MTRCLVPCLRCPQWGERRRPAGGCSGRGGLITPLAHSVTSGKCSKQQDGDKVPGGGGGDGDPVPHEWVRGQASGFPPPRARAPRESRRRRLRVTLGTRCRGRLAAVSPRAGGRALCPRGGGGLLLPCFAFPRKRLHRRQRAGELLPGAGERQEGGGCGKGPSGVRSLLVPSCPSVQPGLGRAPGGLGGSNAPVPSPGQQESKRDNLGDKMKEFMRKYDKNADGRIEMAEVSGAGPAPPPTPPGGLADPPDARVPRSWPRSCPRRRISCCVSGSTWAPARSSWR